MNLFKKGRDFEQLVFCHNKGSGLKAIICIHDTTLGPALGGTRMYPYKKEKDAITDVLRLAKGMTYKASAAGLTLGGGKAVIIGDPTKDKSEALFRAFGEYVNRLSGKYITAEDVGTKTADMAIVSTMTPWVTGLQDKSGDPSPFTALGVFCAMKAMLEEVFGTDSFEGRTVAVQGIAGGVGYNLAKLLAEAGAILIGTGGRDKEAALRAGRELGAKILESGVELDGTYHQKQDQIYDVECDVFAPCAMGAIINDETLPRLRCKIVCGGANNQLLLPKHGDTLHKKGIPYGPDYLVNAGGLINVSHEITSFYPNGYNREEATAHVKQIYGRMKLVIELSKRENIPTYLAADRLAEERIKQAKLNK